MTYARTDIAEIADEYVLGLLDERDQADVESEMERDADLRAAIAARVKKRFMGILN